MRHSIKIFKFSVYVCLTSLFLVSCGGTTTTTGGNGSPATTGTQATTGSNGSPATTSTPATSGPEAQYPAQPSECGSDCPPPFPVQ